MYKRKQNKEREKVLLFLSFFLFQIKYDADIEHTNVEIDENEYTMLQRLHLLNLNIMSKKFMIYFFCVLRVCKNFKRIM